MSKNEIPLMPVECDICGIEHETLQWPYRWSVLRRWTSDVNDSAAVIDSYTYHLCQKCTNKFIKWIEEENKKDG